MATKPTLDSRMQGYNWTVLFRTAAISKATSNNNTINHTCVDAGEKKGKISVKEQDLTNNCVNTNLINESTYIGVQVTRHSESFS